MIRGSARPGSGNPRQQYASDYCIYFRRHCSHYIFDDKGSVYVCGAGQSRLCLNSTQTLTVENWDTENYNSQPTTGSTLSCFAIDSSRQEKNHRNLIRTLAIGALWLSSWFWFCNFFESRMLEFLCPMGKPFQRFEHDQHNHPCQGTEHSNSSKDLKFPGGS